MMYRNVERRKLVAFMVASCLCALGLSNCTMAASDEDRWTPLFDGRNLDGWSNPYDWGKAWVEDGQIVLQADKKFFLVTEKRYRDFIFEGEVKMPEGQSNSGFMFRCQ